MHIHVSTFDELVRTRRSIRSYTDQPVAREVLFNVLETATWAPSAHNRQPWRFVAITKPQTQTQLANAMGEQLRRDLTADGVPENVINQDVERSHQRITSAAVLVCLCLTMCDMDIYPDPQRNDHEMTMAVQSTAMAGQNLLLAAHAAGLGTCWMCAPLFCPEVVKDVLHLPDDWQPQGLITIGYPAQTRTRTRRPVEDCTIWR